MAVHPRLRGELRRGPIHLGNRSGSSPLTRGTRLADMEKRAHDRFIPAYAGNSFDKYLSEQGWQVHPRLRGELIKSRSFTLLLTGSSPLTRGTPFWWSSVR